MSFGTARDVASHGEIRADIAIVGAGAAGLTVACELNGSGLDVVVLEAGGLAADLALEREVFAFDSRGVPLRNPIPDRGRVYGGSTGLWFGRVTTPSPIDFEVREWVANSGWPISLDDIEPWIPRAAARLGVAFPDKLMIDAWPESPEITALRASPLSDLQVFLWAQSSDVGRSSQQRLTESTNVHVLTDATVTGLVVDEAQRVRTMRVVGPGANTFDVLADTVVLAAGGLENPRLLLASNDRHAAGLGNLHDNVGRYYLDHPRTEALARVDTTGLSATQIDTLRLLNERTQGPYGPSQLRVVFEERLQRDEGLLNHSAHGYLVSRGEQSLGHHRYKLLKNRLRTHRLFGPGELASTVAKVAVSSPDLVRLVVDRARGRNHPSDFLVVDQLEQVPDPESRVSVDGRRRDRFGLPRLQLDWRIDASTLASHRRLHEVLRDTLRNCGIDDFQSALLDDGVEPDYLDMKHPSGTTRMSASPRRGVVDADGLVHGTKNLYVLGSSTFPTVGHFNPTLMIVALATRLADRLRPDA